MRIAPGFFLFLLFVGFFVGLAATELGLVGGLFLVVGVMTLPSIYVGFVYYYGLRLLKQGNIRAAEQHYTRILRWHLPVNRVFILTRRAALRNALGDAAGAIEDYTAAMANSQTDDATLYGMRSALYLSQREFDKALDDTEKLLALRPYSEVGYANRAAARMYLGDAQGAVSDATTGLENSRSASGKALLYNNRGTAHRLLGDYNAAISDYNLALSISLHPQEKYVVHPNIITNQGILYYLQEDYDVAKSYFQQARSMMPNFFRALAGLAIARFKLGHIEEAKQLWYELITQEPRYRDAHFLQRTLNWPVEMLSDAAALIEEAGA